MRLTIIIPAVFLLLGVPAPAKVDLVTLPARDTVQLTIYNEADLTLVRESRALTLQKGLNKLQFSWANTLIDPTSLEMTPKANADKIAIFDLTFPPRVVNVGLWNIKSEVSGNVPVEITYMTSGLAWRAFYMGTMTPDEKNMRLEGYVRVMNDSGEDYENAQTRLIVGKVHILDEIAELARRQPPYGRPGYGAISDDLSKMEERKDRRKGAEVFMALAGAASEPDEMRQKEIRKEGLSEYFLYTIEGTETIPSGWSKRLPSFEAAEVPVVNLYKYEEERYGNAAVRFLSFKNDDEHKLGETPIPGGVLKVYRDVGTDGRLSYEGQSGFKYIPVGEDVELNLGAAANVVVESKLMDYKTDNYLWDKNGNVSGWEETKEFKVEVKNTRPLPVKVEIKRNFDATRWTLQNDGDYGEYEKEDADTVKYTLSVPARAKKVFSYVLTTGRGLRAD